MELVKWFICSLIICVVLAYVIGYNLWNHTLAPDSFLSELSETIHTNNHVGEDNVSR